MTFCTNWCKEGKPLQNHQALLNLQQGMVLQSTET